MSTAQPLSDYATTWGDRLRRIRLAHGMDQAQFAQVINVKKPTVGKYELQPTTPRQHALIEDSVELHLGEAAAAYLRGSTTDYEPETSSLDDIFPRLALMGAWTS